MQAKRRVAICLALLAVPTGASEGVMMEKNQLTLTTKKVVVFKDGHFLAVKTAHGTTDAKGEMVTADVPDVVVLGTLWAKPKNGTLLSMKGGWSEVERKVETTVVASEIRQLLEANQGKKAAIVLADRTVNGVIERVLTKPSAYVVDIEEPEDAMYLEDPRLDSVSHRALEDQDVVVSDSLASLFVLRTQEGDLLLRIADIKSILVDEMETTVVRKVTTTERTKRLVFKFAKPNVQREMEVSYFRPGIRWVPTYHINLQGKGRKRFADLRLQAEFINDAEDLVEVPVDIVVGVPNFRFKDTVSPLVLESSMGENVSFPVGSQLGNQLYNALGVQEQLAFQKTSGTVQLPDALKVGGSNDLFVYSLPTLTLEKGERAAVPILDTRVSYQDVYTWRTSLGKEEGDQDGYGGSGTLAGGSLRENDVWHQIEMVNNTEIPWTTGTAMLTAGAQPIAQELMTYTASGDSVRVPLTVAVNVPGSISEEEVGRVAEAEEWKGWKYTKVLKKANLRVSNGTEKAIDLEIVLELGGKVDEAPLQGEVTLFAWDEDQWGGGRGSEAVNNASQVRWKRTLEPEDVFEPAVTYYYFVKQ